MESIARCGPRARALVPPEIRRPGTASSSTTARCCTARRMRSTRSGGAREIADSLYAELYGVRSGRASGGRCSGTSRDAAASRHGCAPCWRSATSIACARNAGSSRCRNEADTVRGAAPGVPAVPPRARSVTRPLCRARARGAGCAIGGLAPRERLRLACYYVQELTLAETGRVMKEHEATVSRQLARTRRAIREDVERWLESAGLNRPQIAECFASLAADPGPLDLTPLLREAAPAAQARERSL